MYMNAKDEFLNHVGDTKIKCVLLHTVKYDDDFEPSTTYYVLKENYTPTEFDDFLSSINIDYESGYGSQNLYGTIWYTDGSWSERGEYDGSEWWEHKTVPPIPDKLK